MTINVAQAQAGPIARKLLQDAGDISQGIYAQATADQSQVQAWKTEERKEEQTGVGGGGVGGAAVQTAGGGGGGVEGGLQQQPDLGKKWVVASFDLASTDPTRLALTTGATCVPLCYTRFSAHTKIVNGSRRFISA
jgi:hypothetical protein